jgi:hypothetical protein
MGRRRDQARREPLRGADTSYTARCYFTIRGFAVDAHLETKRGANPKVALIRHTTPEWVVYTRDPFHFLASRYTWFLLRNPKYLTNYE